MKFCVPPVLLFSLTAFTGCTDDEVGSDSGSDSVAIVPVFDLEQSFLRIDSLAESPSGHSVAVDCSATGDSWADSTAEIAVYQTDETTQIDIVLAGARPDTLFTAWLRLKGTDPETGETFGSSPITGAGSTPLAPTTDLTELAAMMDTAGATEASNGFTTDAQGNGTISVTLDFGMIEGAYPFERYDETLEAVGIVGSPYADFMVRLASHCTDGLAHGLVQGDRESWFNWYP